MQYIDCLFEFGDIHQAVNATCVLDPYFSGARTDVVERLPVIRFKPRLTFPNWKPASLRESSGNANKSS